FLLEEQIPLQDGESFVKYIHNGSPQPNLGPNKPEYYICLFLCACQHLQYIKTHCTAFVSDFQGAGGLLTDAQIMTLPLHRLFGGGNVDTSFQNFSQEHQCNVFCQWMDLNVFSNNEL
ncbi:hypothetical protein GYMLUDRAFT_998765, partial [Collybiopsis luxurians FD-317 M1]